MRTLIIKTGAAGDVVRTTALLNILEGEIWWVTSGRNKALLPGLENLKVHSTSEFKTLENIPDFDLVLSLEEDTECALMASGIKCSQLTGIYNKSGIISYTNDSSSWFDMSRVSRLGMEMANELKKANRLVHQAHMFKMVGKIFNGEKYKICQPKSKVGSGLIGIETRSGDRWPNKQWGGYVDLINKLQEEGRSIRVFAQRENLVDYLADINECSYIVSGDTLAMHIAMAYGKKCSAIFNCTSPDEIYDYGLLSKIVSPLLMLNFYSTSFDEKVVNSISVGEVYNSIRV